MPDLTIDELDAVRDFYVWEWQDIGDAASQAFCFCATPVCIPISKTPFQPWLEGLLNYIRDTHPGEIDFRVRYEEHLFRGHRDTTVEGIILSLRRIPTDVPRLEDIVFPPAWQDLFMLPSFLHGGLVLIAAVTGQGKSTTVAGMVRSRLEKFGGYCRTIEDPPESPLQGRHGNGYCIQTPVDPALPQNEGYAAALRSALRSYPTLPGGGTICVVGEVRDGDTAAELIRAAVNGHLVITTVHASSAPTAIGRLAALAEPVMGVSSARDLLSSALRLVVHQQLHLNFKAKGWGRGRITGEILYSGSSGSGVANTIREGKCSSGLAQPLSSQNIQLNKTPRLPLAQLLRALDPGSSHE